MTNREAITYPKSFSTPVSGTELGLEVPKICYVLCAIGNRASQNQTMVRIYLDTYIVNITIPCNFLYIRSLANFLQE